VIAYNEEASVAGAGSLGTADANGHYVLAFVPIDLSVHTANRIRIWQTYGSDTSYPTYVYAPKGVAFGAAPVDDGGEPIGPSEAGPADAGAGDAAE
jgi:hypothetical protein